MWVPVVLAISLLSDFLEREREVLDGDGKRGTVAQSVKVKPVRAV